MSLIEGEYFFYYMDFELIIATSEKYSSESERDNYIEEVKRIIYTAPIKV